MPDITTAAYGPLFGPDFVIITVNDDTGLQYQLQVFPDANNEALKENGIATQYYYQPARVYLAKKQDSPADFDFGMTVFKGLMTEEDTLGITSMPTTGGDVEAGGGFATFTTTFAVPASVIANAIKAIKAHDHPTPAPSILRMFNFATNDPDPLLGIVSITDDEVLIGIPDLVKAGGTTVPNCHGGDSRCPPARPERDSNGCPQSHQRQRALRCGRRPQVRAPRHRYLSVIAPCAPLALRVARAACA